jgi:hypothetical protein
MKALPIFDAFMLRWARGFSAFFAGFLVLPVFLLLFSSLMILLMTSAGDSISGGYHNHALTNHAIGEGLASLAKPDFLLMLVYSLLWFACVRTLQSRIARVCLGLTAALPTLALALSIAFLTLALAIPPHPHLPTLMSLGFVYLIALPTFLGFLSMIWISLRPPL